MDRKRTRNRLTEVLKRLARIVAVALPVAALVAFLAHQRELGWNPTFGPTVVILSDGTAYVVRDGFAGNPILWGPWAQTSYPSGAGIVLPILLWLSYGTLAGAAHDWWLRRRAAQLRAELARR